MTAPNLVAATVTALVLGCAAGAQRDALEKDLPSNLVADYRVFASRCSKCHPLARPLQSGITDKRAWAAYVARMRLQPGSGISAQDVAPIMRFLDYYAEHPLR
jgi:hypothetical protein